MVSGVAMVKGGLSVPWAIMMSLIVYAGSAQLAALPLIVAGAPLWVIVATGLITNLRFVIYSAALRPYFAAEPLRKRAALGFFMTDFTFTRFMRAAQEGGLPKHSDSWFAGVCSMNWITWQVSALTRNHRRELRAHGLGSRVHRDPGARRARRPQPERAAGVRRRLIAAVVALIAYPLPFKLGLFCGAIAGIVAASIADARQRRTLPPDAEAT